MAKGSFIGPSRDYVFEAYRDKRKKDEDYRKDRIAKGYSGVSSAKRRDQLDKKYSTGPSPKIKSAVMQSPGTAEKGARYERLMEERRKKKPMNHVEETEYRAYLEGKDSGTADFMNRKRRNFRD